MPPEGESIIPKHWWNRSRNSSPAITRQRNEEPNLTPVYVGLSDDESIGLKPKEKLVYQGALAGKTQKEMAQEMGMSQGQVGKLFREAKKKISAVSNPHEDQLQ